MGTKLRVMTRFEKDELVKRLDADVFRVSGLGNVLVRCPGASFLDFIDFVFRDLPKGAAAYIGFNPSTRVHYLELRNEGEKDFQRYHKKIRRICDSVPSYNF